MYSEIIVSDAQGAYLVCGIESESVRCISAYPSHYFPVPQTLKEQFQGIYTWFYLNCLKENTYYGKEEVLFNTETLDKLSSNKQSSYEKKIK